MNAKDKALFDEEMAKLTTVMKAEFDTALKTALKDALQPLIVEINELQQRSSNFAARVNASNKIYRAEITRLRELVEATQPKKVVPLEPRIPASHCAALMRGSSGTTFLGCVASTTHQRGAVGRGDGSASCEESRPDVLRALIGSC